MNHSRTEHITTLESALAKIYYLEMIVSKLESQDEVLNTQGACKLLKISRGKIFELIHSGQIPHVKKSGNYLYSRNDLLEWFRLEGRKNIRPNSEMAISQSKAA